MAPKSLNLVNIQSVQPQPVILFLFCFFVYFSPYIELLANRQGRQLKDV